MSDPSPSESESYYIGIDVGTGSARAALVSSSGHLVASHTRDIRTWRDKHDHRIYEQSTTDIWGAICATVHAVLAELKQTIDGLGPEAVKGIGFDATCSLAVVDSEGVPVSVTREIGLGEQGVGMTQSGDRNIILWADHRAEKEAEDINATSAVPLEFVGGTMSLEMEIPKILWLKRHMPAPAFARCHFFDLPDYLTYRATGTPLRSFCSLTCKCSYVPSKGGWQREFFEKIGLGEFEKEEWSRLGGKGADGKIGIRAAGMPVGKGLSRQAAKELGLVEGTPVGSAIIDAYAGWLGTVAARHINSDLSQTFAEMMSPAATSHPSSGLLSGQSGPAPSLDESKHRLAAVAGTSTCYIVNAPGSQFVPGVWGPYRDAVFPGWWMNEGGQSATGQLIEFVIMEHHAYPELKRVCEERGEDVYTVLHYLLLKLKEERGVSSLTELTKDLHVYPDLHGNRSPLADPKMRGSIVGLELDMSLSSLVLRFNATLEAIALQTRHIVDTMNEHGHAVNALYVSGSQAKNEGLMALVADVCEMEVVIPERPGAAVVLGAAMLGRMAREVQEGGLDGEGKMSEEEQAERLWKIMVDMTPPARVVRPMAGAKEKRLLQAKYEIFREAIEIQQRWRAMMQMATSGD